LSAKIYIAIPALNELAYIGICLSSIAKQTYRNFELWVCVNQPESWHTDPARTEVIKNNQEVLNLLATINDYPVRIIDRSTRGNGWDNKKACVGWARKIIMDEISGLAKKEDIILSLDADTSFGENYLASIINIFKEKKNAVALANPYYHPLTGDEKLDRTMLRYEIYMRYYAINMFRIGSPYSYTALGSAIALPNIAYQAIGGITPKKSGEDFYFLQKLAKYGKIVKYNTEKVFPATRYSDRVFFGTGPALIKGSKGDWESYPIYHYALFDHIKQTFDLYPALFHKNVITPLSDFLNSQFNEADIWEPLRKNFIELNRFVEACHQKVDGLRLLQYLKTKQLQNKQTDDENLRDFLLKFYGTEELKTINTNFEKISFSTTPVAELNAIRDFLVKKETEYQEREYLNFN
jgi:glycosyltransferase involved in cell wall biosynthesis